MQLQEKLEDTNSQNGTDVWPQNKDPKPVIVPEAKVQIWL
jgi:hypothetical protein